MVEQALYHQYIGGTVPVPPLVMRDVMLAAPALIDRSMTYNWPGVSGKGNRIIPRWQPNKKRKDIYHHSRRPISFISFICHLPDPPCFSLATTFKQWIVSSLTPSPISASQIPPSLICPYPNPSYCLLGQFVNYCLAYKTANSNGLQLQTDGL